MSKIQVFSSKPDDAGSEDITRMSSERLERLRGHDSGQLPKAPKGKHHQLAMQCIASHIVKILGYAHRTMTKVGQDKGA